MRALLLLLVLALALPARAVPGWGLLLGLRLAGREGASPAEAPAPDRYRTLYVTAAGAVSKTPLLVPRQGRLWDVGVRRLQVKAWVEDEVYAVPHGQPPPAPRAHADPRTTSGWSVVQVTYAGPHALGLARRGAGFTEGAAHPWASRGLEVVSPDRLGEPLTIQKAMGTEAWIALRSRAERYLLEHPGERERLETEPGKASWGLERRRGAWITRGWLGPRSQIVRDAFAAFDLDCRPPRRLVPHDRLEPGWATVFRHSPGALDAFSSPDGRILAVLTPGTLLVFEGEQGLRSRRPLTMVDLEADERPVSIEWGAWDP